MGSDAEVKPEGKSEHINIKVRGPDGNEVHFKLKRTTPLSKLMGAYAERVGKDVKLLKFLFDGERIQATQTPADIEMEDDNIIDVQVEQLGGSF